MYTSAICALVNMSPHEEYGCFISTPPSGTSLLNQPHPDWMCNLFSIARCSFGKPGVNSSKCVVLN